MRRGDRQPARLYPGIPAIEPEHTFYPLKAFIVSAELMPALGPRVFMNGKEPKTGTINELDGPSDTGSFRVGLPFGKLREFLAREEKRRQEDPLALGGPGVPDGFTFGVLDIVTFPFWFMLTYSIDLDKDDAAGQLWRINSNLLNHFYPTLRLIGGVLTIPHYHEEPIDDAPTHNIVLWRQHDSQSIRTALPPLIDNGVPTHFVSHARPVMDDRYALHSRRPGDGKPFNLREMLEVVIEGR